MSKPTITTAITSANPPAAATPAAAPVYNPLSLLAVLGLGCGGVYALIVAMSTLVALSSGAPLFLPDMLLLLPIGGAGLSLLAFRQIQNSEGTLSGTAVAKWGLILSIVAGLGYGAYYLSTGIAVQSQANHFLMTEGDDGGFFELIQKGDTARAFLLTRPWTERQSAKPEDRASMARYETPLDDKTPRGKLALFADDFKVQLIVQAGREGKKVQPLGVKSWKYDGGEYEVERSYRIDTEELTLDIVVIVKSNDGSALPGEARKWTVLWDAVHPLQDGKFTPLGLKLLTLRQQAAQAFESWQNNAGQGKMPEPFPLNKTNWASDQVRIGDAKLQKKIERGLDDFFSGKDKSKRPLMVGPQGYIPWTMVDEHLQLYFMFVTPVPLQLSPTEQQYLAEVRVALQAKDKGQPSELTKEPGWRVVSVEVLKLRDLPSVGLKKTGPP